MRFFDRTEEIASLKEILELSKSNAQFTVVTGRRRIGKTSLVWKAYENEPILYFLLHARLRAICVRIIYKRLRISWVSRQWAGRSDFLRFSSI